MHVLSTGGFTPHHRLGAVDVKLREADGAIAFDFFALAASSRPRGRFDGRCGSQYFLQLRTQERELVDMLMGSAEHSCKYLVDAYQFAVAMVMNSKSSTHIYDVLALITVDRMRTVTTWNLCDADCVNVIG